MAVFGQKDGIVTRHIGGESILVPVTNSLADLLRIFVLNPVGECIWQALEKPSPLEDLCDIVVREFDVETEQARGDCEAFLKELEQAGLLEVA